MDRMFGVVVVPRDIVVAKECEQRISVLFKSFLVTLRPVREVNDLPVNLPEQPVSILYVLVKVVRP